MRIQRYVYLCHIPPQANQIVFKRRENFFPDKKCIRIFKILRNNNNINILYYQELKDKYNIRIR